MIYFGFELNKSILHMIHRYSLHYTHTNMEKKKKKD